MIKTVRIAGYKSLVDVSVDLARMTVVFGPNSAGKSNLLDALSLLNRMITSDNLDAAFKEHRGNPLEAFTLPPGGLEELQNRETARFSISVDTELSEAAVRAAEDKVLHAREGLSHTAARKRSVVERKLRYSLSVEIVTGSGHLRVVHERLEALKNDWSPKESRNPFVETFAGKGRVHVRIEKQAHPLYEDLGQDRAVASKPFYPPHHPHLTAFKEEVARWRFYFLEPSAMREDVPLKEVEFLAPDGSDLAAFYNTLKIRNSPSLAPWVRPCSV